MLCHLAEWHNGTPGPYKHSKNGTTYGLTSKLKSEKFVLGPNTSTQYNSILTQFGKISPKKKEEGIHIRISNRRTLSARTARRKNL